MAAREHQLDKGLDCKAAPVLLMGGEALLGHLKECGSWLVGFLKSDWTAVSAIDPPNIVAVHDRLVEILGASYEDLRAADDRGQSSATPPASRHQIIRLIKFCEYLLEQMINYKQGDPDYDVRADMLAESMTVFEMSHRWRKHPAWPLLEQTLKSGESAHTIMLLAVASAMVDADNGIGIHVGNGERIADLWIQADLNTKIDVEIKTPELLRTPSDTITPDQARVVLSRHLKGSKQQRRTKDSILAVGGYHLGDSLEALVDAAAEVLQERRHRSSGLVGILLVDCTYEISVGSFGQEKFDSRLRVEFVRHPGFTGNVSIQPDAPRTLGDGGWPSGA